MISSTYFKLIFNQILSEWNFYFHSDKIWLYWEIYIQFLFQFIMYKIKSFNKSKGGKVQAWTEGFMKTTSLIYGIPQSHIILIYVYNLLLSPISITFFSYNIKSRWQKCQEQVVSDIYSYNQSQQFFGLAWIRYELNRNQTLVIFHQDITLIIH